MRENMEDERAETAEAERDGTVPDSLEELHDLPWSAIEGSRIRVRQEVDDRDPLDPTQDRRQDLVRTRERSGEIVGRAEGTGLYFDSQAGEVVPEGIGPCIYLDTPEDTILEVRTDKLENELVSFDVGGPAAEREGGADGECS